MIVHCNFEELTALKAGARQVLDGYAPEHGAIAAPPAERERWRHSCPGSVATSP